MPQFVHVAWCGEASQAARSRTTAPGRTGEQTRPAGSAPGKNDITRLAHVHMLSLVGCGFDFVVATSLDSERVGARVARERPGRETAAALAHAARVAARSTRVAVLATDVALEGATSTLSRRLGFTSPGWDIVLDVIWTGELYSGEVRISPPRPVDICVYAADAKPVAVGSVAGPGKDADATITPLPPGPCKLTFISKAGTVETEWFTLPRPELTD